MTSYIIAGSSDARETTECETLARNIKTLYSNINFIMILKHPNEWNACIKEICRNYGFKKPSNPIIFTSDGKLIGSTLEFNELAETKFGFRSHMVKDRLDHQVNKNIADQDYTERHREKHLIEIIEEKYQEALKSNKISKQTGEFKEIIDHGLVYYVKDTHSTAPIMKIPEQRILEIPVEVIPDVQIDFKEKVIEESILPDSIRPGSQPQDASKKGSNVLSDPDKPKTPVENAIRKKDDATNEGQPAGIEGEEVKQENPENPENPEGQPVENGGEEQPQEEQQPQLEVIAEEDPPEEIPPENPEYPNVYDYVIANVKSDFFNPSSSLLEIFGDYYLCLHPQPLFEGQCILVHKTEKPVPIKKVEELKEAKSNNKSGAHNDLANHSELDQPDNVTSPSLPVRKYEHRLSEKVIDAVKPEVADLLSTNAQSKPKADMKTSINADSKSDHLKSDRPDDTKSDHALGNQQSDVVREVEEEDHTEKLYTKDFSRTGRFRSGPKKSHFTLYDEDAIIEITVEIDEHEERKEKEEDEEDENESYFIRNHTDILKPLSKLDWQTAYKIVKDTDSLAFLQWLPKDNKNYLQLNNEVCHVIPRKFLLLEWKNAGIIGVNEEKDDLLPFERIIYSVIMGPKHEITKEFTKSELPFRHKLISLDENDTHLNFSEIYRQLFLDLNSIYDGKLVDGGVNVILGKKFLLLVPLTQPIYRQNDIPVFPVPMSYIGYILRPQLTDIWPQTAKIDQKEFKINPYEIMTRSTAAFLDYVPDPSHDLGYEEEVEEPEPVQQQEEQPQEEHPLENNEEHPLNPEEQQALGDQAVDPLQDQAQLDGQGQQEGVQLQEQPQHQAQLDGQGHQEGVQLQEQPQHQAHLDGKGQQEGAQPQEQPQHQPLSHEQHSHQPQGSQA